MYIRSISSIVASILIIVITVAIAGIFYAFTSGLFGSITQSSSQQVQQQSQVTSFTINNIYCSNNTLYLIIYNNGNIPIDTNEAITIISYNQNAYNTTITCNNTTIIQPGQQITCNLNNIICYYDPLSNSKYKVSLIVGGEKAEKYLGTGYGATPLLPGYSYLRDVIIDNSLNSNSLTDYQILVTLDTQSLISQGKMRSDCGDIRFTDFDGALLNYWIEPNTCNTSNTKIWVKVPFIPGGSTETIYLWYGNPNATSQSSVANTFIAEIDGLVACWHFDEGSGNVSYDSSGNNHTAIIYGATWVNGYYGKALQYDGVDDYVSFSNITLGDTYTFVLWAKTLSPRIGSNPSDAYIWLNWQYCGDYAKGILLSSQGYFFFQDCGVSSIPNSGFVINSYVYPQTNVWYFLAAVRNSSSAYFYVNGTLVGSVTGLSGYNSTSNFGFLSRMFNTYYSNVIDEVYIFNQALSEEEITDLYNYYGYTTLNYPGIVLVRKYTSPEPSVILGTEVET